MYIGRDIPYSEEWPIGHNIARSIQLDHTVVTYSRHNLHKPGTATNLSVKEVTKKTASVRWEGSMVVLSKSGPPDDIDGEFQDVTLEDLRITVDYFIAHSQMMDPSSSITEGMEALSNFAMKRKKFVKGVRINCNGDRFVNNRPKYEEVDIPLDHPIHEERPTSLSLLLALPILVWKYPADKAWQDMDLIPGKNGYYNEPSGNWCAMFMNVNTDISSENWGRPPIS